MDAYGEEHPRRIQVVHTRTATPIEAARCKLLVTKRINRCNGAWHYSYASFTAEFMRSVYLSRQECEFAVNTGTFYFEGRKIEATPGGHSFTSYVSKGSTSTKGHCNPHPEPFVAGNSTFSYHLERTSLHIELKTVQGVRDFQHDQVVFDDLRATLSKGFIHAPMYALYWNNQTEVTCDNGLLQSFDGTAQIRKLNDNGGSYDGAIVMVEQKQGTELFAGFKLSEKVIMCNRTAYATNVAQTYIYIVPYNADVLPLAKFGNSRYTKVETIQILTGNTAMHIRNSLNMYGGFKGVTEDLCRVERGTIHTKLNMLASGDRYALTKEYGPGYQFRLASSVAYVAKCEEKEATLASFPNCTREIPVYIGPNDTSTQVLFADPLTYNLVPSPTVVACDTVMPQKWVINGAWYCSWGKGVVVCRAPKTLDPKTTIRGIPNFAIKTPEGIFSKTQLEQHAVALALEGNKDAVITELIRSAIPATVTHPDGSFTFGVALPEYQIEKMQDLFLWNYFSLAWFLGTATSTVMYIILALRMLKWFFETILLFFKGWKRHGRFGKWILGLALNSFRDVLLGTKKKKSKDSQHAEEGGVPLSMKNAEAESNVYEVIQGNPSSTASSPRFGMRDNVNVV